MRNGEVERGSGPWPSTNTEQAIRNWLVKRIEFEDAHEVRSSIDWMLDEVSGHSKAERIGMAWAAHESQLETLALWADRMKRGEPLHYILGKAYFRDLVIAVDPRVLIPRPETEELVYAMEERLRSHRHPRRVLDLGTGSGIIPLDWKSRYPADEVYGLDVSPDALEVARTNAERLHIAVEWIEEDVLRIGATPPWQGVFDVIFSNPPYIPWAERGNLETQVKDWEPAQALFVADEDPLVFYRHIIRGCEQLGWLAEDGWLGLECHRDGVAAVAGLFDSQAWTCVERLMDMQGNDRMILARRSSVIRA